MVSLEDLYSGTTKKLSLSCSVICTKCTGKGSKSGASTMCFGCGGSGMKEKPSGINDRCPRCNGNKVVQEKKVLEVHVEKGMQHGQKIKFLDRLMKFQALQGDDLTVEHKLSLTEALCGFQFALTHLDGRKLLIKSNPGEVTKPGSSKAVNDEGMPMYGRSFMKGKLCINFTVDFPDSLTTEQSKALEGVLQGIRHN
ncbi:hypothetical protein MKW92_051839 [Papaver armeniacum]|nr:hypothetical protein MKW92_051839 [Papaver armeniacum]